MSRDKTSKAIGDAFIKLKLADVSNYNFDDLISDIEDLEKDKDRLDKLEKLIMNVCEDLSLRKVIDGIELEIKDG